MPEGPLALGKPGSLRAVFEAASVFPWKTQTAGGTAKGLAVVVTTPWGYSGRQASAGEGVNGIWAQPKNCLLERQPPFAGPTSDPSSCTHFLQLNIIPLKEV